MDSLTRKRRGGVVEERQEANLNREAEHTAALGQPETSEVPATGARGGPGSGLQMGEASPGAMEAGEAQSSAAGLPFFTGEPFSFR